MDWNPALLWLALSLLLALAELTSGAMVLLALGVAALVAALLAWLGLPLAWQLIGLALATGVLVPLAIKVIRPWFSPRGVAYGTTGTGVEKGRVYRTLIRDYDGATGIKVNGDFYRLRVQESAATELPLGTAVVFKEFDGTTAIVTIAPPKEH
nr:nodulation efficiency, NfeD-like protein [Halomonas socia]